MLGQVIARGSEVIDAARLRGAAYKIKIRSCTASRLITPDWRMRDVRRGLPSGVSGDPLAGQRYNIREVDAITDPDWIYLVVESGSRSDGDPFRRAADRRLSGADQ